MYFLSSKSNHVNDIATAAERGELTLKMFSKMCLDRDSLRRFPNKSKCMCLTQMARLLLTPLLLPELRLCLMWNERART